MSSVVQQHCGGSGATAPLARFSRFYSFEWFLSLRFFTFPKQDPAGPEAELNGFLSIHGSNSGLTDLSHQRNFQFGP